MTLVIKKATKTKIKLKISITAPSGGGKTYSALKMAHGIVGDWEKICVIDTENGSASLYSDLGPYDTIELTPPFEPEKYVEAIRLAVSSAKYEVIIIDSMSHEWEGVGGSLQIHGSMAGNSFANWAKVTPRHDAFVQEMLQAPVHVIGTARRKTDYDMTRDGSKTVVTKVGLKQVQREGLEYEFAIVFALDQNHYAKAEKDRTRLFDKKPEFIITEKTGQELIVWANSSAEETPKLVPENAGSKSSAKEIVSGLAAAPSFTDRDANQYDAERKKFLFTTLHKKGVSPGIWEDVYRAMKGKTTKDLEKVLVEVLKHATV